MLALVLCRSRNCIGTRPSIMLTSADIAIKTVLCLLVIVDIVGNALVCAVVKRNRDMRYAESEIRAI